VIIAISVLRLTVLYILLKCEFLNKTNKMTAVAAQAVRASSADAKSAVADAACGYSIVRQMLCSIRVARCMKNSAAPPARSVYIDDLSGCLVHPPPIGERSIVMSVSVCVCLSVRDHIFGTTRPIFTKFFVRVTYRRGSVLFWRRSDNLCTSGYIDDVIFAHKPRLLDVAAQLKRSAHAALGLAINCAQ